MLQRGATSLVPASMGFKPRRTAQFGLSGRQPALVFPPKTASKKGRQHRTSGHGQANANQRRWGASGWVAAWWVEVAARRVESMATRRVEWSASNSEISHQRNCRDRHATEDSKRFHRKSPHQLVMKSPNSANVRLTPKPAFSSKPH